MLSIDVWAGTGHRPGKLFDDRHYGYTKEGLRLLVEFIKPQLKKVYAQQVITGMAIGYDQCLAMAAYELGMPFIAAVPCKGQDKLWTPEQRKGYHWLLNKAAEVHTLSKEPYRPQLMHARNEWMVDRANAVLALWDGTEGGTYKCVRYAMNVGTLIDNVWPEWLKYRATHH